MVKKTLWIAACLSLALLFSLVACAGSSVSREPAGSPLSAYAVPSPPASREEEREPVQDKLKRPSGLQEKAAALAKPRPVPKAEAATAYLLVNKDHRLPPGYRPGDLVYPDVPFIFAGRIEKRMLRKPAAKALEQLFAAAKQDGLPLAGVSAYRSRQRQKQVFRYYVRRDGLKKALTYSAYPGASEHETGLAVDVSGADGRCAASDCFAGTREARWLARHAHEYGFIIRYPRGKQAITGYKYEPWHLRYVGRTAAKYIYARGITLEEYEETAAAGRNHPAEADERTTS